MPWVFLKIKCLNFVNGLLPQDKKRGSSLAKILSFGKSQKSPFFSAALLLHFFAHAYTLNVMNQSHSQLPAPLNLEKRQNWSPAERLVQLHPPLPPPVFLLSGKKPGLFSSRLPEVWPGRSPETNWMEMIITPIYKERYYEQAKAGSGWPQLQESPPPAPTQLPETTTTTVSNELYQLEKILLAILQKKWGL